MISYEIIKTLGLKINTCSTSLIVSATGPSVRPLGIIKDLPIEIEGTTIPMDVEVMDSTSYSLLLGNDWSQKVNATYNWKNKAYTLKWNNKKIHVPTTYETNQPLPSQPTITEPHELDEFEKEFLTLKEAYVVDNQATIESENEQPWTIQGSRFRNLARPRLPAKICSNCSQLGHLFAECPDNQCN